MTDGYFIFVWPAHSYIPGENSSNRDKIMLLGQYYSHIQLWSVLTSVSFNYNPHTDCCNTVQPVGYTKYYLKVDRPY